MVLCGRNIFLDEPTARMDGRRDGKKGNLRAVIASRDCECGCGCGSGCEAEVENFQDL